MADFTDDDFYWLNAADTSKRWVPDASAITTSSQRVRKLADFDGDEVTSVGEITQTGISFDQFDTLATGTFPCLVMVYLEVVTAATSGTLSATISWTDHVGATTAKPAADLNIGSTGRSYGTVLVFSNGGSVDCSTTFTAKVGTPSCALTLRCIPLP